MLGVGSEIAYNVRNRYRWRRMITISEFGAMNRNSRLFASTELRRQSREPDLLEHDS